MNFETELAKVLSEFPNDIGMRVSIRINTDAQKRHLLNESKKPQTGIYWWLPSTTTTGILDSWHIISFWSEFYNNPVHFWLWNKYIIDELIATLNLNSTTKPTLYGLCNSLPRGRILKKPDNIYAIHHGNIPKGCSVKQVINDFCLPEDAEIIETRHESLDIDQYHRLCKIININLGLDI